MRDLLPRFIVIKPVVLNTYVCYESESVGGHLYSKGESVFEPLAKIEIEPAKNNDKYCHLRFCHSNRYWARNEKDLWYTSIAAVANKPEEDTSKNSCTLFEPKLDESGRLSLTHVRSEMLVTVMTGQTFLQLWVNYPIWDPWSGGFEVPAENHLFTFVDWESLVKIPKHVALKGSNGKFLKAIWQDGLPYLQFSSADGNDSESLQVVVLQPDGHLRIKSAYHGKFWRRSPNWIWADSSDDSGSNVDTLFWPVKIDDKTIALRNEGNNGFVKGLSVDFKDNCLNAAASSITNETKLVVEELVLDRHIYNVRFLMDDARVTNEQPYLAAYTSQDNPNDTETTLHLKAGKEITTSSSFTHSYSIKFGGKLTIKSGIPFIAEGEVEVNAEYSGTFTWGTAQEDKTYVESEIEIKAPPRSRASAYLVATQGTCSVPFTYSQRDTNSTDGMTVTSQHTDGIFYGVNYYGFRFEQLKLEPLSKPVAAGPLSKPVSDPLPSSK